MINRRNLLKTLIATTAAGALPSVALANTSSSNSAKHTWKNWSGNQVCHPSQKLAPASVSELQTILRTTKNRVRVVGSGHSFTPLVPTSDTLISIRRLNGLHSIDSANQTATMHGGSLLSEIGPLLASNNQALINMPDVDQQTLAGAIATATHGTGQKLGSLSAYVSGIELITASGDKLYCDENQNHEIFKAAQVSLGSLGVITQIEMQNTSPFKLKRDSAWMSFDEAINSAFNLAENNRNFEFFYFPFTDMCLTDKLNVTEEAQNFENEIDGNEGIMDLKMARDYLSWSNKLREMILQGFMKTIEPSTSINDSYRIYANERNVRFNEMEYHLPAEHGLAALKEVKQTIEKNFPEVFFPIECRFIKSDDIWISPFYGRETMSIAVHRYFEEDYTALFKAVEPIFKKYQGRPHWGKINTLTASDISERYPKWKEFKAVRETLDPTGKFLNPYLKKLFIDS